MTALFFYKYIYSFFVHNILLLTNKVCYYIRELIDKIDIDEKLIEECEKAFREHSENLEDAYIAYIKAHRSSFEI